MINTLSIMKNLILKKIVLLLLIFTITSCSSDDNYLNNKLIGSWTWTETSGGLAGTTENPQTTGHQRSIEFTNTIVKRYLDGNLESEMSYELEEIDNSRIQIIYSDREINQTFVIEYNILILYDRCDDCSQFNYVKN